MWTDSRLHVDDHVDPGDSDSVVQENDTNDVPMSVTSSSLSTASTASSTNTHIVNTMNKTKSHPFRADDEHTNNDKLSRAQQLCHWLQRLRQTFGTSFLLLVSTVYIVQGFTSFSALAVNYFFKEKLELQPAESQSLMTVMMVPWGIKPLYGIISDSLPLFGYHRKSYMMLCSVIGTFSTLAMAVPDLISTPLGAVLMLMVNSLSTAVIDVVIDARVVEMSRLDPKYGANDLQSVSWVSISMGGVLGSFLSGPAAHNLGVRGVFFFAAIGPLTILFLSIFMHEVKTTMSKRYWKNSAKRQLRQLKSAICTPVIWMCALWIFLSGAISPGYSQVMFYFSTDVLKFTPEFLGIVSAFGFIFLMVGTMLYNACFKDTSFRRVFLIAQISLAVISLLDIVLVTRFNLAVGIPDKAFVLGDAVIGDVISRLKTMPVIDTLRKAVPQSEFWGALVCTLLGIAKDEYNMLWLAIILRSVLKVVPIFFLYLIPATDPQKIVDELDFSSPTTTKDENFEDEEGNDEHAGTIREDHAVKDCSPNE
ncbi:unnamed protein product [Peronospora destructor]|uniref:Uncharacterized protein n=1 Tax=Peronospora destructor TaxID=86335 RepID=A0AAV0T8W0_9STRA|nr:unnamed protein product [Peronospora destructor]